MFRLSHSFNAKDNAEFKALRSLEGKLTNGKITLLHFSNLSLLTTTCMKPLQFGHKERDRGTQRPCEMYTKCPLEG